MVQKLLFSLSESDFVEFCHMIDKKKERRLVLGIILYKYFFCLNKDQSKYISIYNTTWNNMLLSHKDAAFLNISINIFNNTCSKSNLYFIVQNNDLRERHYLPGSFNITYNDPLTATYSDMTEIVELDDEDGSTEKLQAVTRMIIYIILSLIFVLFLILFMLGSRDLIAVSLLPPIDYSTY